MRTCWEDVDVVSGRPRDVELGRCRHQAELKAVATVVTDDEVLKRRRAVDGVQLDSGDRCADGAACSVQLVQADVHVPARVALKRYCIVRAPAVLSGCVFC